jgi:hypothetical protein
MIPTRIRPKIPDHNDKEMMLTYDLDGLAVLGGETGKVSKNKASLQLLVEHVPEPGK